MFDLAQDFIFEATDGGIWDMYSEAIINILVPAFSIAVGFVAYKLIKRALKKA